MGLQRIFQTARLLGDKSSLDTGVGARVERRLRGRLMSGAFLGFNIWGLIAWGQFLSWMRDSVQQAAGKQWVVGTWVPYARRWERRVGYFDPSVRLALLERTFPGARFTMPGARRSGVYGAGRFLADIRGAKQGVAGIATRGARRTTGAESSRLFWGALSNPEFNIFRALAERVQELARRRVRAAGLVDSGALLVSIETGATVAQAAARSIVAARRAKFAAGDVAGAMRMTRAIRPAMATVQQVASMGRGS